MQITNVQARNFLLRYHGLGSRFEFAGKPGILDFIRRVGSIQFDTLNIVGRNPELVLQSRISEFRPVMLDELLYQERRLLDGSDKEMCIYHIDDWPYFRRRREAARLRFGSEGRPVLPFLSEIQKEIADRGPLSSSDLNFNQLVDWPWAPTRLSRAALESMFLWGDLVIHHKVKSRKIYDLSINHIRPSLLSAPDPNISDSQYYDWCVLRRIGAIGLLWNRSGEVWTGISQIHSPERNAALNRLLAHKKIFELRVEGIRIPMYVRSSERSMLSNVLNLPANPPARASILAPLDNMLWDRQLVKDIFDFAYRWEVYKPISQRQYGYYVLPILYGDRFVARFEPARDKASGALIIKNWWWESGIQISGEMGEALQQCFRRFLHYLGTDKIQIDRHLQSKEDLVWINGL